MKRFILNIALFLLILVPINYYFYRIVFENYYIKYEQIEPSYNTYLLADSHGITLDQLNDEGKFYNFSAKGDSYVDMKRKLNYLVANSQIKRLILTVDNHTLSTLRDESNNIDRSCFFAEVDEYDNAFSYFKETYLERYIPLVNPKSRDILQIYFLKEKDQTVRKKWVTLTPPEREEESKERILRLFPAPTISSDQMDALQAIISTCQEHSIELIGIKFPLSKEYITALGDIDLQSDSCLTSHGYRVIDFTQTYVDHDSLFKDQDHLNLEGGKLFTQDLLDLYKD